MKDCYLGVDIGSISTKGVIIDDNNNIITQAYIWTEGNPTKAVKNLLNILKQNLTHSFVSPYKNAYYIRTLIIIYATYFHFRTMTRFFIVSYLIKELHSNRCTQFYAIEKYNFPII